MRTSVLVVDDQHAGCVMRRLRPAAAPRTRKPPLAPRPGLELAAESATRSRMPTRPWPGPPASPARCRAVVDDLELERVVA